MRLAFWKKKEEDKKKKKKKPVWREWLDAAVFAVIAATLIRTFIIEAYTIPSGSMEGTMLVNDYLFVSKLAYGPRMPMTPLSVPLVNNTLPIVGGKSYSEAIQWGYHRLPGFGEVKRYDVVVFNFPNNDTVMLERPAEDYYQAVRAMGRARVWSTYSITTRPIDKEENYIKRCVGVPGDTIQLKHTNLYVNGKKAVIYPHQRMEYVIQSNNNFTPSMDFMSEHNIIPTNQYDGFSHQVVFEMEKQTADRIRKVSGVTSVAPFESRGPGEITRMPGQWVYPQDTALFHWNVDNYGPLVVPKKGMTIALTPQNIALYKRCIRTYEKNEFEEKNGQYFINGKPASQYTFKMDYYWMMGDNRHESADSRYFGFVPEDHIVGKASFVWLSYGKDGIRWGRILRSITHLEK